MPYGGLLCLEGIRAPRQLELQVDRTSGHHLIEAQLAAVPRLGRGILHLDGHVCDAVAERAVGDVQVHCLPQRGDDFRTVGAGVPVAGQRESHIHLPSRTGRCHMQAERHQIAFAQVDGPGKVAHDAPPAVGRQGVHVEQGCPVRFLRPADVPPGCGSPFLRAVLEVLDPQDVHQRTAVREVVCCKVIVRPGQHCQRNCP